ncbi:spore coat protein GerQ [Paenibacillus sp. TRM 82003]|nr:spore coat protein GerQ [Paenibacillus sp. TRM 82003]
MMTYPQGYPYSFAGQTPVYPTTQTAAYPTIPSAQTTIGGQIPAVAPTTPQPVFEESYIENILRLNLGKTATIYMTFENNAQWNAKIFKGRLEAAGRDHIIISDLTTGMRYLLLMVNLDYITFEEELNYEYPGYTPTAFVPGR